MQFIRISKGSNTIAVTLLQQGPWKVLDSYICALALRIDPQEYLELRNRVPGGRLARLWPKSGEGRRQSWPRTTREGAKGCYGPVWVGFGSGGGRRRGVRQRPVAAAAAGQTPAWGAARWCG
jgi:hypothetical protein